MGLTKETVYCPRCNRIVEAIITTINLSELDGENRSYTKQYMTCCFATHEMVLLDSRIEDPQFFSVAAPPKQQEHFQRFRGH